MILKIFVYGTLKKGYGNHGLLKTSKFIGNGYIKGWNIYDLGFFPGIRKSQNKKRIVYGEVYEIDDITRMRVDSLEGEGSLYNRVKTLAVVNGEEMEVSVYVFARNIEQYQRIEERWDNHVL